MTLQDSLSALRLHCGTFADSPEFRQVADEVERIATQSLWQEMEQRLRVMQAENFRLRQELKAARSKP